MFLQKLKTVKLNIGFRVFVAAVDEGDMRSVGARVGRTATVDATTSYTLDI